MHSPSLRSSTLQHGKPRRQDRNTPRRLIERGLACAGVQRFCLDPASNSRALVDAVHECYYGGAGRRPKLLDLELVPGTSRWRWRGDGLLLPWEQHRHVWCNPPWNNCGDFVMRAAEVAVSMRTRGGAWSIQLLVPLRTHREWWAWACTARAWCLLKPVAFEGFPNAIPTPCAILYWGDDIRAFGEAWGCDGIVLTRIPRPGRLAAMPRTYDNKLEIPNDAELMIDGVCRLLDGLLEKVEPSVLAEVMASTLADWTPGDLARFIALCDRNAYLGSYFTDVKGMVLEGILGINADVRLKKAAELMLSKITIKQALAAAKPVKAPNAKGKKTDAKKAASGTGSKRGKKKTTKSALRKATEKKAPKKAASKKAPKAASKKAAGKKAPKKAAGKKAPKAASRLELADGVAAAKGTAVFDESGRHGTITAVDASAKNARVKWSDTGSISSYQVAALRWAGSKKNAGKAANDGPLKPDVLDEAIVTQLLPGRTVGFKCKDVATTFHVSESTALRSIRRLEKAGKVSSKGAGRAKEYFSKVA